MELEAQDYSLDNLLEILGNPTRRVILSKLTKVPHSTSELAKSLDISRQAVHSQLQKLLERDIIEEIDTEQKGSKKYRIKSNLSLRIDISPDYYNVDYSVSNIPDSIEEVTLSDLGCSVDYGKISDPNEKLRYLGENIKKIEKKTSQLEEERRNLLQQKECFIIELKNIMSRLEYQQQTDMRDDLMNLEKEIFYTLFFNPQKFHRRINLDKLLDELFFSDIDSFTRQQNKMSIEYLLKDLSRFMDFLREDEDNWFFDI